MPIYLNNAATSWPKPKCVSQAISSYLEQGGANLSRGSASARDMSSLDMVTTLREQAAQLLGGYENADPRYVTLTSGVTESLNIVLKGLIKPEYRVLTTSMEHNAVIRPLRSIEKNGAKIGILQCNIYGKLNLDTLKEALKIKADLLVMSHCSNVCGTLQPIEEIADICTTHGVSLIVDAAQTAGVVPIDAQSLNLAALCFTGHKGTMGPQGTGGIVWKPEVADMCSTLIEGGTGSYSHLEYQPTVMPDKFEAGTPNLPGMAGLSAALSWIEDVTPHAIHEHETRLGSKFLEGLKEIPQVTLYGMPEANERLAVFAIDVDSMDNGVLADILSSKYQIETRPGLHCAPLAHRTLGSYPKGLLRVSLGYFNAEEEIKFFIAALKEIIKRR